jgi:hypothetical protein
MKNKMPNIQKAWRQYKELYEDQQGKIHWVSILLSTCDIFMFMVPYWLATFYNSTHVRPKKFMGHRKNRNI